jgi:hypothetical protein
MIRAIKVLFLLFAWLANWPGLAWSPAASGVDYPAAGLQMADYLLNQQDAAGAIPDEPGGEIVNEDSNMQYALIGLAAAYRFQKDSRYLNGLEKGLHWLAAREEMSDPSWRGSWSYAYSIRPPYQPQPLSPGPGVKDVRGVDATSALFVYLLYQYRVLSGSETLAVNYQPQARAALDFVLDHNRSPQGFFYSSWQLGESDGEWRLWRFCYTADQADVYLGLQAGWLLYHDVRYFEAAEYLRKNVPSQFFDQDQRRYTLGIDEEMSREPELEAFNGIFPQGYLPWVWGLNEADQKAYTWLAACEQPSGSLVCYPGDPQFSLSAALYGLSAARLGRGRPVRSMEWVLKTTFDPLDGGVRDSADQDSPKFSNVAGFMAASFLDFPPFPGRPVYFPLIN